MTFNKCSSEVQCVQGLPCFLANWSGLSEALEMGPYMSTDQGAGAVSVTTVSTYRSPAEAFA